jgi:hypothetical protein
MPYNRAHDKPDTEWSETESEQEEKALTSCSRPFPKRKPPSPDPDVPNTRRQMLASPAKEQWLAAEQKEIDAMAAHDVWDEVPSSEPEQKGSPVITSRWVYRLKRKVDHTVEQFKARLTARGFLQVFGVDYDEVFAAVVLLKSFRLFIALSVLFGWRVTQLDIGNAFLNGNLDKPVYMKHPDGFPGTPGTVLRLKKSIYGLKNAPRIWWNRLFSVLSSLGFRKNRADPCVLQHATWAFIICHHTVDLALSTNDERGQEESCGHSICRVQS